MSELEPTLMLLLEDVGTYQVLFGGSLLQHGLDLCLLNARSL